MSQRKKEKPFGEELFGTFKSKSKPKSIPKKKLLKEELKRLGISKGLSKLTNPQLETLIKKAKEPHKVNTLQERRALLSTISKKDLLKVIRMIRISNYSHLRHDELIDLIATKYFSDFATRWLNQAPDELLPYKPAKVLPKPSFSFPPDENIQRLIKMRQPEEKKEAPKKAPEKKQQNPKKDEVKEEQKAEPKTSKEKRQLLAKAKKEREEERLKEFRESTKESDMKKRREKIKKAPKKKPKVELKTTIPIKVQQSTMGNLKPSPQREAPKRPATSGTKEEKKKLTAKEASDKLQDLDRLPKREAKKVLKTILESQIGNKDFLKNKLNRHLMRQYIKDDDILKRFGLLSKEEEKEEPKRTMSIAQAVSIIKRLPTVEASKRRIDLLKVLTNFKGDKKFYKSYKKEIDSFTSPAMRKRFGFT
jgi:hypothetical protein